MRQLWKEMGGYDALVEYNECAVRQFMNKWEREKTKGIKYRDFLKEQSSDVDINLGFIEIEKYRQDIYLWYLVHPYGCIDQFVSSFKNDLKVFGFDIRLDFDKCSELEKLIRGLKDAGIKVSVDPFKIKLDNYYRRCRNLLAHKLDEKEREKIEHLYNDLDFEAIHKYYPSLLSALTKSLELSFDDYTLCTANLKNITDILTTDVYKNINWDKYDMRIDIPTISKINKYAGNPDKQKRAIILAIRCKYGISIDPETALGIQQRI